MKEDLTPNTNSPPPFSTPSTTTPSSSSASAAASSSSTQSDMNSSDSSSSPDPFNDTLNEPSVFDTKLKKLSENGLLELLEGLETLLVYTKNLILFPDEKKYRKIKITNIHYQERLGHLVGAQEAMTTIGYIPQGEYLRLDESRIHSAENQTLLTQMERQIVNKLNELKKSWAVMPERTEPSHAFTCVQAVGSHSAIGKRHNMEDDEIMIDQFCGVPTQGYFGLYDGHGGRATVDFVVKALHMVRGRRKRQPIPPPSALGFAPLLVMMLFNICHSLRFLFCLLLVFDCSRTWNNI